MCRSLIFDRVGDWDQRTVHSCAKHKLITRFGSGTTRDVKISADGHISFLGGASPNLDLRTEVHSFIKNIRA